MQSPISTTQPNNVAAVDDPPPPAQPPPAVAAAAVPIVPAAPASEPVVQEPPPSASVPEELPLSSPELWDVPPGMVWEEKKGRAKAAVWDFFRLEVPVGTEQAITSEIVCVHAAHEGKRTAVKAMSNTSNLHKHLSHTHGIVVEGTRGAAQTSAAVTQSKSDQTVDAGVSALHANGRRAISSTRNKREARDQYERDGRRMRPTTLTGMCRTCFPHEDASAVGPSGQEHEDDNAAVIVVCAPSLSKTMGALHPAGALYARPVHINQAREAHAAFVALLRRRGIETHDVRDILAKNADWNLGDRCHLEELAAKSLTYVMEDGTRRSAPGTKSPSPAQHYISDDYKKSVLREMDVSQLVDIVMTNPTVSIADTGRDTGFLAKYSFCPSTNIMFTRDQQITTVKGVVMARLQAPQRRKEVDILEFCLKKLGVNVLGRVGKGFLEGGDFFPAGPEMCFVGIGPRSTYEAVYWMMEKDICGTQQVVVVRDENDMSQDRMHLDCVFNIVGKRCCIMLDTIMSKEPDEKSRFVDVWRKVGDSRRTAVKAEPAPARTDGKEVSRHGPYEYVAEESHVEFSVYMKSIGYTIIPITAEEQLEYGCNVLNLGGGRLIATEENSGRRIATHPAFTGTVEYLDFSAVTAMYGGVHCASQVVRRTPT